MELSLIWPIQGYLCATYDRLDRDIMPELIEPDTERLRLRQWLPEDRAPFAAMGMDREVMEHFPTVLSRAESDAFADHCQASIEAQGWGFWAVECKHGSAFAGFVGLCALHADLPFAPGVEIGWRLARRFWGRGLATEAARAALQVGFERLGLDAIVSFTAESNLRSRAVMERLAMRHVADFEHPLLPPGHALSRHRLYRMDAGAFAAWRH